MTPGQSLQTPGRSIHPDVDETTTAPSRPRFRRDALAVVVMLAPAVAAIWLVPWFVTQDGLAHLYNAEILVDSLKGGPRFGRWFEVRWDPLPNWGGHLTLMGLLSVFPSRTADRLMTTITLLAPALAAVWLRGAVGGRSTFAAKALAALSAMSFSWLMGFASFQLGVALFAVTLGVWWKGRNELRPGRMAAVAVLLTVGYFCHLVSVGLTLLALGFLALATPTVSGGRSRLARVGGLAACAPPLLGLMVVYLRLSRRGGEMAPYFPKLIEFFTVHGWMGRLGWVDPISFSVKNALPFTATTAKAYFLLNSLVWLAVAAFLLVVAGWAREESDGPTHGERRAWFWLAAVLAAAGVFGPDSMGSGHGDFLPQRVALLGMIAAVPAIDPKRARLGLAGSAALGLALALQTVSVWDYADYAQKTVAPLAESAPRVGRGRRVAVLLGDLETRFRVSPPRHVACWFGVTGDNAIWNDYETRHYYFPVHFRPDAVGPDPGDLEAVALRGRLRRAEGVRIWDRVLARHADAIDVLVEWRSDPELDDVTAPWFRTVEELGEVRILRPRGAR